MRKRTAIIIGAGPAGLTAAYELARRAEIQPIVLEQDRMLGGLCRTVNFRGNRLDIGGHRFFSKSDRVMQWWLEMLPLQRLDQPTVSLTYQNQVRELDVRGNGLDPQAADEVMLLRPRKSRIYHSRKLFDYPVRFSKETLLNLGLLRSGRIGLSYLRSRLLPIRPEKNLEDFFINRFGRELYRTFFKSYTEKVWGVPCQQISAEWGAQRIKRLSVGKALAHAVARRFRRGGGIHQREVETSLIEQFLYPKYGPGQMWETCAKKTRELGGVIITNARVHALLAEGNRITGVVAEQGGRDARFAGDYVLSTMPIRDLIRGLDPPPPVALRQIAEGLVYRDFITVGLLVERLEPFGGSGDESRCPPDNWIYIQEPDVLLGRLQIYNNWSPYMVADPSTVWLGLEYFCSEADDLWRHSDAEVTDVAVRELVQLGMMEASKVLGATVLRMPKAYPAYFGTYGRFGELRAWLDRLENLFLIGRNGMHQYNNQDHSMLAAMAAVEAIMGGTADKRAIWAVNAESEYHETAVTPAGGAGRAAESPAAAGRGPLRSSAD